MAAARFPFIFIYLFFYRREWGLVETINKKIIERICNPE